MSKNNTKTFFKNFAPAFLCFKFNLENFFAIFNRNFKRSILNFKSLASHVKGSSAFLLMSALSTRFLDPRVKSS